MTIEMKSELGKVDGRKKNGGARPNSGRKPGTTNRYSSKDLLASLRNIADGKEYVDQLAEDYWDARFGPDKTLAQKYHHLISSKVFADKLEVEIDETSTVESRQVAFLKALETIGSTAIQQDDAEDSDKS